MHPGQIQRGFTHVGKFRRTSRVRGDTLMTPNPTAIQVLISGCWGSRVDRYSGEGLNTGRYEKTPVRCPCSLLATLHCAPRTQGCYDWRKCMSMKIHDLDLHYLRLLYKGLSTNKSVRCCFEMDFEKNTSQDCKRVIGLVEMNCTRETFAVISYALFMASWCKL